MKHYFGFVQKVVNAWDIGLVDWAGSSCALFGYLDGTVIFGPSYINFSLSSEKMEFQKLPGSKFNQFLASFNLPSNECSIEPVDASILLRTTSGGTPSKHGDDKKEDNEVKAEDLIFLLYIGAGIVGLFDVILGILIITAIILEKRKEAKERKKELEERLKAQAAVITFEAKKREREKQRKERKEKLEKGLIKPLKHINTESEKVVIQSKPQKIYVPEKQKQQPSENNDSESSNKKKQKRRKRKNEADAATISEKLPSIKPIKKDVKNKSSKKAADASSTQTSQISESQPKQISSAISDKANDKNNLKK
uniref:Uncharacterized protein n=1 Tax=Panagrolaimus sp. ES5 TaxID=591445 RepID=A0AC34F8A4_9BILA